MSEELRFQVHATEEAYTEIATAMATQAETRDLLAYAHARSALASVGAGFLSMLLGHLLAFLVTGRPLAYLPALLSILAGLVAWRFWALKAVRRHASITAQKSPLFSGPQTWILNAEGVFIEGSTSSSRFDWATFDRVVTGPSTVGLVSGAVFFALPLTDVEDRKRIVERVETWMQE